MNKDIEERSAEVVGAVSCENGAEAAGTAICGRNEEQPIQTGKSSAEIKFEEVYELYWKLLLSISRQILNGDEAYDAFQHCLLRIYRNIDKIGEAADYKTKAFVCKIMKNEALRLYKSAAGRYSREVSLEVYMRNNADKATDPTILEPMMTDEIKDCFDMLSSDDRRILVLRHISGYSNDELENILKISGAAVRKRISRARQKLGEIMLKQGIIRRY